MQESRKYQKRAKIWGAAGWSFVILALLGMVGLIVVLIMLGFGNENTPLLAVLCGVFVAAAGGCGGLGAFALLRGERSHRAALDALEREDSEESFFVGEDTLATFREDALVIHSEKKKIVVPYGEIRLFSVCTRRKPKEKGEWSVLIELPASYVLKKAKKEEPPVLIQTDGKERLYRTLERRSLVLLGEPPAGQESREKYTRLRDFAIPDPEKRKHCLLLAALGAVLTGGGVGFAFYMAPAGAAVAVAGAYVLGRAIWNYTRAKRVLSVYREGLYLKELTGRDSFFLKWAEIVSLSATEGEKGAIRAECPYGAYDFPRPSGAYEYLKERFPDKCGK